MVCSAVYARCYLCTVVYDAVRAIVRAVVRACGLFQGGPAAGDEQ